MKMLLLFAAVGLMAQVPRYEVKRTEAAASPIEFVFPWEFQTGAKQKTVARLWWDDQHLHVAYECDDSDITAQFDKRDDPTYKDDAVELFINPKPSQSNYFGLEMNAKGTLYDYFYVFPEFLLKRMDFTDATVKAQRTAKGWKLDLKISWADFEGLSNGKPPKRGDVWTANLNRWDGTEPNRRLSQWSNSEMPKPNPHNPKRFGQIVFVD